MDFEPLSIVSRALTPGVIVAWVVLSAAVALLRLKKAEAGLVFLGVPKDNTGVTMRRAWIIEPLMFAMLFVMAATVWHQITGDFISFSQAWPAAIVMGFAFSLLFVTIVNLQERMSIALSAFCLLVFTIPGSLFFSLLLFVLPLPVRWELGWFGLPI